MTNPTDPEEQRLLLELAEASLGLHDDMDLAKCYNSVEAETRFDDARTALRDYRAKASAPDGLPDDVEGCPACGALPCDWVNDPTIKKNLTVGASAPEPAPLLPCPFCGNQPNEIGDIGRSIFIACEGCDAAGPEALSEVEAKALWNARHSPALPNIPQIPTHESIIQWAKEKDKESLRTGEALKWTELIPDFARVFGLAQPDERVVATDEALDDFIAENVEYRPDLVDQTIAGRAYVRSALARFNPPTVPAGEVEITDREIVGAFERIAADGDESGGSGPEDRSSIYPISLQQVVKFARALLDKKQPPTGGLNSIDRNGLEQEKPSEPAGQTEITDEKIEFVWRVYGGPFVNDDGKRSFAAEQFSDAARHHAKHSSATSLSNETLRDLWRLAHQEALDQFVTDAKQVVGRSNT